MIRDPRGFPRPIPDRILNSDFKFPITLIADEEAEACDMPLVPGRDARGLMVGLSSAK